MEDNSAAADFLAVFIQVHINNEDTNEYNENNYEDAESCWTTWRWTVMLVVL